MQPNAPVNQQLAYQLLAKYPVPDGVLKHMEDVKNKALKIGEQIKLHGQNIDLDFLAAAVLLHDIGRYNVSPTVPEDRQALHTQAGQNILAKEGHPELAEIAGAHSVVECNFQEALDLTLMQPTKLPDRIEAKIVCVADKLRGGAPEQAVRDWFTQTWDRYFKQRPDVGQRALNQTLEFVKELRALGWDGEY